MGTRGLLLFFLLNLVPADVAIAGAPRLVVVISGGFMSHQSQRPRKMYAMLESLWRGPVDRRAIDVKFLLTSFSGSMRNPGEREELFAQWATLRHRAPERRATVPELVRELDAQASPDTYGILIGHSHGGWLVMMLAQRTRALRIRHLVTIDPISGFECTPLTYAHLVRSWIHDGGFTTSCATGAPGDLRYADGDIRRRVGQWDNFWQQQFRWLHSGPINGATNHRYQCGGCDDITANAHERIRDDPAVWEFIRHRLSADISAILRERARSLGEEHHD